MKTCSLQGENKTQSPLNTKRKVDSRWITNLGMNDHTIKSTGENLCDTEAENALSKTSKT